jgi:glycosyltransferase involved in cell wall biosynthesis
MRVALVHRFFWRAGAVPAVIREWADHLDAAGHEVVVFASDVRSEESTGRRAYVPVRLGKIKAFDLAGLRFAAGLAAVLQRRRRARPDVLLAVDSTAYFGAWLAGKRLRVPTIMAFQGWVYSPGKRAMYPRTVAWMYKLSVHFCARWAPKIACISREIYGGLRALGTPGDRLWLAPNCVDLCRWRAEKGDAQRRAERRVLYVGRFSPEKGLRFLLEALPAAAARVPELRALLVGGDEAEDGEYHEMARRLGVAERVVFGGVVPRDALPKVYADADVLAVPSLAEGHPLAPLECLACGTPVVASDIPGLNETIEDGVNGLLVPPGTPGALAEALGRILRDDEARGRMSRAARSSVERFSWQDRVREFEALGTSLRA